MEDDLYYKAVALGERVASGEISHQDAGVVALTPEFVEFFDSLNGTMRANAPIGRKLPQHLEDGINRHCIVLALLEEGYRTTRMNNVLIRGDFSDADALISIAEDHWIDDLRELSWKFYDRCGHLTAQPSVLNPRFDGSKDVGGADADLILDGTLIEFKCTIKKEIQADWLRQVLGYVLMDYSDKYRINRIGIYMARQGLLFRWDLDEALEELCSGETPTIVELRARFREVISNTSNS